MLRNALTALLSCSAFPLAMDYADTKRNGFTYDTTRLQRVSYGFVSGQLPCRHREAIGMRRSRPNARPVIFTPGGAWRRLYSLRSTIWMMRVAVSRVDIGFGENLFTGKAILDVGFEQRIQLLVIWEGIDIELIRA